MCSHVYCPFVYWQDIGFWYREGWFESSMGSFLSFFLKRLLLGSIIGNAPDSESGEYRFESCPSSYSSS